MQSSSSRSIPKATWTPEFHEIFVNLCVKEALKGNMPTSYLSRDGWMNVVDSFHRQTGVQYDRKQLKNHWDGMKEQYKIWCNLINTPHMKWDPVSSRFGATREQWASYIKANPKAAQFQRKKLPLIDKLETLFGDSAISMQDMKDPVHSTWQNDTFGTSIFPREGQDTKLHETDELEELCETDEYRNPPASDNTPTGEGEDEQNYFLSPLKEKARWTPESHKVFIDLCVEQTLKGNKPGTHFTREGWRNIVELFNRKTGLGFDRMQLKNRWDGTKQQWKIWCKLTRSSQMKWDPNTRKFGATRDDWSEFLQDNPGAALFQNEVIPLIDRLQIIFGGTDDSGQTKPPRQRRRLNNCSETSVELREEPEAAKETHGRNDHLIEAMESGSVVTAQRSTVISVSMEQRKLSYSIGECIQCLDEMEEVEQGSELYLFALDIFLKREYREIFLQLKKPSVRIAWLQRLQSVGQPND